MQNLAKVLPGGNSEYCYLSAAAIAMQEDSSGQATCFDLACLVWNFLITTFPFVLHLPCFLHSTIFASYSTSYKKKKKKNMDITLISMFIGRTKYRRVGNLEMV